MSTNLPPGSLRFADTCIPTLSSGEYSIDVTYTINGPVDSKIQASNAKSSTPQEFRVSGPRFSLDVSSVYSCSPSPGSRGIYETHLPDIVITEPYFPWERVVSTTDKSVPWVALVVLT